MNFPSSPGSASRTKYLCKSSTPWVCCHKRRQSREAAPTSTHLVLSLLINLTTIARMYDVSSVPPSARRYTTCRPGLSGSFRLGTAPRVRGGSVIVTRGVAGAPESGDDTETDGDDSSRWRFRTGSSYFLTCRRRRARSISRKRCGDVTDKRLMSWCILMYLSRRNCSRQIASNLSRTRISHTSDRRGTSRGACSAAGGGMPAACW